MKRREFIKAGGVSRRLLAGFKFQQGLPHQSAAKDQACSGITGICESTSTRYVASIVARFGRTHLEHQRRRIRRPCRCRCCWQWRHDECLQRGGQAGKAHQGKQKSRHRGAGGHRRRWVVVVPSCTISTAWNLLGNAAAGCCSIIFFLRHQAASERPQLAPPCETRPPADISNRPPSSSASHHRYSSSCCFSLLARRLRCAGSEAEKIAPRKIAKSNLEFRGPSACRSVFERKPTLILEFLE